MDKHPVTVSTSILMAQFTKVTGNMINSMAKEKKLGRIIVNTLGITSTARKKEKGYLSGRIRFGMKGTSKTINEMVLESFIEIELSMMEIGLMEKRKGKENTRKIEFYSMKENIKTI